jgi:hypothetical protein
MESLPPPVPPPTKYRPPGAHDEFAEARRSDPGNWAAFKAYAKQGGGSVDPAWNRATSCARTVRTGYVKSFRPAGHYEAVCRSDASSVVVWVRYTGEDGSTDTTDSTDRD